MNYVSHSSSTSSIKIFVLSGAAYPAFYQQRSGFVKNWLDSNAFKPAPRKLALIPNQDGHIESVIFIEGEALDSFWDGAALAESLPKGHYHLENLPKVQEEDFALAWGIATYSFDRYKKSRHDWPTLIVSEEIDVTSLSHIASAIHLVRDLINTPAADMNPAVLEATAQRIAKIHQGACNVTQGDALKEAYPMVYAVGKAGEVPPRLIDLRWGNPKHPQLVLVGKGVCFDTGGLNLKLGDNMRHMKKDMGGAAIILALAQLIMAEKIPVSLRVLIPAVENNVAANAMRPGDILTSKKGITVEIGNTDAEGRLILADALTEGSRAKPQLIIDCATLTGAARVALGASLPALFSNRDEIAKDLMKMGNQLTDPLWQLPLWEPYRSLVKSSTVADLDNAGGGGLAGAITAALFLSEFLEGDIPWVHIDMMAWNPKSLPGRPIGGEAQTLRTLFAYVRDIFIK